MLAAGCWTWATCPCFHSSIRACPTRNQLVRSGKEPKRCYHVRLHCCASLTTKIIAVYVCRLRNMIRTEGWEGLVTVVSGDMRTWEAPQKVCLPPSHACGFEPLELQADIIVSELLGSFGDNELSPECLDGAQRFLKEGGISIPYSYTSYVCPIMSSKLWNEAKNFNDPKYMETNFVVKLHNFTPIAKSKPCFTFVHPNHQSQIDNTRWGELEATPIAWILITTTQVHKARIYSNAFSNDSWICWLL